MPDITFSEWKKETSKTFSIRSSALKDVDTAFKAFDDAKTPGAKTNALQALARDFRVWITLKGQDNYLNSIRNRKQNANGEGPVERLQSLIRTHQATNVGVRRELEGSVPDRLVLDTTLKNLKDSTKVQETYDRAKLAVHAARDTLRSATTAGTERTFYERWFGTYDVTRHKEVMKNFNNLCKLFDSGVVIVHDARLRTDGWENTFGFAMPGNKQNYVEFSVGKAFFMKTGYNAIPGMTLAQRQDAVKLALADAYKNSSDWTMGTMVHELSHAINSLPDVDFMPPSTYQVSPGGLTAPGWQQCSTPALDLALAVARPALAIQNVDNYGQCSREAVMALGG